MRPVNDDHALGHSSYDSTHRQLRNTSHIFQPLPQCLKILEDCQHPSRVCCHVLGHFVQLTHSAALRPPSFIFVIPLCFTDILTAQICSGQRQCLSLAPHKRVETKRNAALSTSCVGDISPQVCMPCHRTPPLSYFIPSTGSPMVTRAGSSAALPH